MAGKVIVVTVYAPESACEGLSDDEIAYHVRENAYLFIGDEVLQPQHVREVTVVDVNTMHEVYP